MCCVKLPADRGHVARLGHFNSQSLYFFKIPKKEQKEINKGGTIYVAHVIVQFCSINNLLSGLLGQTVAHP